MSKSTVLTVRIVIGVLSIMACVVPALAVPMCPAGPGESEIPCVPIQYHGGPFLQGFTIHPVYMGKWSKADIDKQQTFLTHLTEYISGKNAPAGQQPVLKQYGVGSASVAAAVHVDVDLEPSQYVSTCLAGDHYVTAYFQGCDLSSCQTITFPSITATEVVFSSLALSATASSGLSVSFTSMTPKVCTVSGNTASLLLSGDCTIEASQPGNDSFYSALSIQRTFTVNGLEQKITFPPIPTQEVGDELQLKATASSGLTVALETVYPSSQVIILTVTPHFVCYFWGSILRMSNPGTCEVTASQAGNDIYAPAKSITRDFTVVAAP